MSVVLTYDDNKNLLNAECYYGGEGWDSNPTSDDDKQNNYIGLVFKDGVVSYSILWSYWKTMFFNTVLSGEIRYEGWDIHEMFDRLKALAESVSKERKEEESDNLWVDNIYKDYVEKLPQPKIENTGLDFINPEAEEAFIKMLMEESSF